MSVDVCETSLVRHSLLDRQLSTFESTPHSGTAARLLALRSPAGGLALAAPVASANTLAFSVRAHPAVQIVKCKRHRHFLIGESARYVPGRGFFWSSRFAIASWLTRRRQLFDLDQMANLGHHAADRRVVRPLNCRVQLAQSQRCDRPPLIGRPPNRTPH